MRNGNYSSNKNRVDESKLMCYIHLKPTDTCVPVGGLENFLPSQTSLHRRSYGTGFIGPDGH